MKKEGKLTEMNKRVRAPVRHWSQREVDVLREIATPTGIDDSQLHRLPGRSRDSAQAKAVALGITLTTAERIGELMADGQARSAAEIALALGVPAATVRRCATDLTNEGPDQEMHVARLADDGRTLMYLGGAGPNAVRPLQVARRTRAAAADEATPAWWPLQDRAVVLAMHAMVRTGR